jgi:hypothetical protein
VRESYLGRVRSSELWDTRYLGFRAGSHIHPATQHPALAGLDAPAHLVKRAASGTLQTHAREVHLDRAALRTLRFATRVHDAR